MTGLYLCVEQMAVTYLILWRRWFFTSMRAFLNQKEVGLNSIYLLSHNIPKLKLFKYSIDFEFSEYTL